jgi:Arc/MetJ-type ribon-helix-helix transcriptional regulator
MPKVDKTVKLDPEVLEEIERIKQKSNGYVTLSSVVRNGIQKELAELRKIYK